MDLKLRYKKKRKPVLSYFRWYAIFFAVCAAGIWGSFWVPALQIAHIATNDPLVQEQEVRNALASVLSSKNKFLLPRSNMFLFSSDTAERALREAGIGIARVKKHYPNSILVEFENTEPKFILCPDAMCYYVNQNGVISERAPIFRKNPLP